MSSTFKTVQHHNFISPVRTRATSKKVTIPVLQSGSIGLSMVMLVCLLFCHYSCLMRATGSGGLRDSEMSARSNVCDTNIEALT